MSVKHVSLLRGINVGGKNRLKMDALKQAFSDAGAASVTTYIQSGNVVFTASDDVEPAAVASAVERKLGRDHDLKVPMVTLAKPEFETIVAANPFEKEAADDPKSVHVFFLQSIPSASARQAVDLDRSPGDTLVVGAAALYLHTPNGVARSKFTSAYLDNTLQTVATARNFKSVEAIRALLA